MIELDFVRATVLAIIQGLTEFLPVSSSAHLILPSILLGWEDQGLVFDVAVHLGTLFAVMAYFRRDLWQIAGASLILLAKGKRSESATLGILLLLATMPAVLAGFLLKDSIELWLRDAWVLIFTTLLFAPLLWFADRQKGNTRTLQDIDLKTALLIGLAQVLALVPGTSRSGITMTAALFCKLDRSAATRFSFLLAVPVIAGASLLSLVDLIQADQVNWFELGYALLLSMLVAYACIHYFLRFIEKIGFLPFVVYRLLLGSALLILVIL